MKKSKYPRLRSHTRKGKAGQVWTWWVYDMRPEGKPDIPLGSDYDKALQEWDRLHNHVPNTKGLLQEAIERWRLECLPTYTKAETLKGFTRQLANVEAAMGHMSWHEITLPVLAEYLRLRTAKTQGNREMSVLSLVWGKARLWGMTELMWPATGVKNWKNPEQAREFEVTDDLFNAVYEEADQILRDAMDIASATSMRVTDARTVQVPVGGRLKFKSSKTGKWAYFDVSESPTLLGVIERRGAKDSLQLLTTPAGGPVSYLMLRDRWNMARAAAALKHPALADDIRAMYLRDMRRRAADLAGSDDEASQLLQHSSKAVTQKHYRTKATKLRAVR